MVNCYKNLVYKQKLLTGLVACRCAAMDFRGHGDTKTVNDEDLCAETMARYMFICGELFGVRSH